MPRTAAKRLYVCNQCGEEYIAWQGKCSSCGQWNTLSSLSLPAGSSTSTRPSQPMEKLTPAGGDEDGRWSTSMSEFDRVLGGGIVGGSVILMGGEPGVGKSTLLLQVAQSLADSRTVAYFSGEESSQQVGGRAKRLGITPNFYFANETRSKEIAGQIEIVKPDVVIIDSIQTLYDDRFPSTPGSLVQVRECALGLQTLAKSRRITMILVGHITKEGTVAGPKTLEHMVDVVLYLEGDTRRNVRILRSAKNRFGATHEIGLFTLGETGMTGVDNPSVLFTEESSEPVAGSALTAVMEGNRPILVEVQALVVPTSFGYPKRTALGLDGERLAILLAILEARAGVVTSSADVFVNVVGGYRLRDRHADLGVCLAIASARSGVALPKRTVVIGEVGLSGHVGRTPPRLLEEVKRLGYRAVSPLPNVRAWIDELSLMKSKSRNQDA